MSKTSALEKLLHLGSTATDIENVCKVGFKKIFFLERADLIFELVDKGVKYPAIIEALEKDGVKYSYDYFKILMANERKRRSGTQKSHGKSKRTEPILLAHQKADTINPSQNDSKQTYLNKIEAIKQRKDLTSKERRDLMKAAEEEFSMSVNKLGR